MKYERLIIEKKEYVMLKRLLNVSGHTGDESIKISIIKLNAELTDAKIVDNHEIPSDVVRFNSNVTISSSEGWERTIQLVMPSQRNFKEGKISVLTPMGAALFGYASGDEVEWQFPSGFKKIKIRQVEQEPYYNSLDVSI